MVESQPRSQFRQAELIQLEGTGAVLSQKNEQKQKLAANVITSKCGFTPY